MLWIRILYNTVISIHSICKMLCKIINSVYNIDRMRNINKSKRLNKSSIKGAAKGGAATVMPLQYYNPGAAPPSASAGRDLLGAIPPIGVRPKIGGERKSRKAPRWPTRKSKTASRKVRDKIARRATLALKAAWAARIKAAHLKEVSRKSHKSRGGFVPSIMDGFVEAASRFIVPLALYSGYKLLTRKQKKHK